MGCGGEGGGGKGLGMRGVGVCGGGRGNEVRYQFPLMWQTHVLEEVSCYILITGPLRKLSLQSEPFSDVFQCSSLSD